MTRTEIYSMMADAANSTTVSGTEAGAGWPNSGPCGGVIVRSYLGKTINKSHTWGIKTSVDGVMVTVCAVCGIKRTEFTAASGKKYTRYF